MQHPFLREVNTLFAGNTMRGEIAVDGKKVFSVIHFTNIVNDKDIKDAYGQRTANRVLKDHKDFLEPFKIYTMRNTRGSDTAAMTFTGLKAFLSKLPGKACDKYMGYCIQTTTLVEAGDDIMKDVLASNKASSNICNEMARDAVAHERDSGGPSLTVPSDLVLATGLCCALVLCCCCGVLLTNPSAGAGSGRSRRRGRCRIGPGA